MCVVAHLTADELHAGRSSCSVRRDLATELGGAETIVGVRGPGLLC